MSVYLPPHFAQAERGALHDLVAQYPLGMLVSTRDDGLCADHLPFEYDPSAGASGTLRAHVARGNGLWRAIGDAAPVLVVFQGPDAYVSPAWYPGKAEHGRVVPTWNYAVVHAYGTARAVLDRDWLRGLVDRLTRVHEAGRPSPWSVDDAPADYIEQMLSAIVGIEVSVDRLIGKFKLSQNRNARDHDGVRAGLSANAQSAVAALMASGAAPR